MSDYIALIIFLTPIIALLDAIITLTTHIQQTIRHDAILEYLDSLSDISLGSRQRADEISEILERTESNNEL